jgi:hypothetical protein
MFSQIEPLGHRHKKLTLRFTEGSLALSFLHAAYVRIITAPVRVYTREQLARGEIHPDDWL